MFTDKESLVYEIKTDNVYEDFHKDKDFSNYPKDSKCDYQTNMNEIGKMKNESEAKIIIEFAGLKSELYCLICIDDNGKKKDK